jgi:hypothetical protein
MSVAPVGAALSAEEIDVVLLKTSPMAAGTSVPLTVAGGAECLG